MLVPVKETEVLLQSGVGALVKQLVILDSVNTKVPLTYAFFFLCDKIRKCEEERKEMNEYLLVFYP